MTEAHDLYLVEHDLYLVEHANQFSIKSVAT